MKFKKYPSIENSYQEKHMNYLREHGFARPDKVWCVTEKLHGSNLGIYCDENECRTASRNNLLQEKDSDAFYKFVQIKEKVYEQVVNIFKYFDITLDEVNNIVVYGELFGGAYPHPEVERNTKVSSVQKGVFYSPNIHFHIFDIMVVYDNGTEIFIDYDFVTHLCKMMLIPYCEILFIGTMDECLAYANNNKSTIPGILGLPEIEDNIMEGTVVKPIKAEFLKCGSKVVLKNKNEKFKEKNSEKKHQKTPVEVSKNSQEVIDMIATYITENRLDSVESKLGEIEQHKIGDFIREFVRDVFEDASKEGTWNPLSKDERKVVNKFVSTECKKLIFKRL